MMYHIVKSRNTTHAGGTVLNAWCKMLHAIILKAPRMASLLKYFIIFRNIFITSIQGKEISSMKHNEKKVMKTFLFPPVCAQP